MYRRLLGILRPHSWRLAATIACNLIVAALDVMSLALLIPFLQTLFGLDVSSTQTATTGTVQRTLNALLDQWMDPADKMGSLQVVVLIILGAITLKNVFAWLSGQLGAGLQELVTRDLRDMVYRHMVQLPLSYFQRTKTGQVVTRILTDTAQTKALVTELVTRSLQSTATIIVSILFLLSLSWKLTLVSLVLAPLLIGLLQPILRKLRKRHRRLSNEYGEMTSIVQEAVSGIRLVKATGAEPHESQRFTDASGRYAKAMTRVSALGALSQPLTEVAGTAIAVLVLWIGAREVLVDRTLDGGALIAFLVLVLRMLQPLKQLSQVPATAQASLASAERLFEVLDERTEATRDTGTREVKSLEEGVRFENVTFTYGDEAVLSDVTFDAPRGEIVALVGASGAGKSTLVDLVPRFNAPTSGRILLDGIDLQEIRLESLRRLTGIVSQDTVLFNDTVRANIAFGAPGVYTQEQVEEAARAANAHQFISELPQGYDTVLGERGTRLSGGQRQRVAIARALLSDPPILILDEATSALDTESERLVQEAIDRLLAGRTVFVIAHRLSTVEHAHQILVLDRGRIIERGTHDVLLAQRGAYHRLYTMQFRERELP
ncbi:MAG TPA: ABC transporter transmembrane domain-containing protein, partial [Gemmatimonadaceae bacterium]|nr:ABC transporter transmembrane domain-containing protein [Gemmatimonadaceae bacterium]